MQVAAGGHVPGQLLKFSVKDKKNNYVHVQRVLALCYFGDLEKIRISKIIILCTH